MPKNGRKDQASATAARSNTMIVEVLHPITYQGSEYSRGVHHLVPDVAEFFLAIRVPNRMTGPQAVARLPLPAEEPKRGEVKLLSIKD